MKKPTKFKSGDIVVNKINPHIKILILYPLFFKEKGIQRYEVSWYDNNQFQSGTALETELQ